jgi:hypothetical protein
MIRHGSITALPIFFIFSVAQKNYPPPLKISRFPHPYFAAIKTQSPKFSLPEKSPQAILTIFAPETKHPTDEKSSLFGRFVSLVSKGEQCENH